MHKARNSSALAMELRLLFCSEPSIGCPTDFLLASFPVYVIVAQMFHDISYTLIADWIDKMFEN